MSALLAKSAGVGPSPVLPALMDPRTQTLLTTHAAVVHELVNGLGSPLHFMLPQAFTENATAFQTSLRRAEVEGQVLYAKKANKAHCLVAQCAALGLGVDAASVPELAASLEAGVPGPQIGVSGPDKHPALLRLALLHDCLVAMDSVEELARFVDLASSLGRHGRVLLRWRPPSQPQSRFGLDDTQLAEAVALCAARKPLVSLEGFSFHLSGYAIEPRAAAAHWLVDRCLEAQRLGLRCDTVDIGGGFAMRYVDSSAWHDFVTVQTPRHYHANKRFDEFYPYASECHGAAMLTQILAQGHAGRGSLARRLRAHGLRLLLEPGRALLDQAGVTAFRVQGVKERPAEGYGLVTVDGMSFSLSEQWFNSEYLPDPLLLRAPDGQAQADNGPFAAAVAGASCLDSDMVSWRKLRLPHRPRPGDLLVYLNTAGYQMDSNESAFHGLALPRKVVVALDETGPPRWRLDEVASCSFFHYQLIN